MTSTISNPNKVVSKTVRGNTSSYGSIALGLDCTIFEIVSAWTTSPSSKKVFVSPVAGAYYATVLNDVSTYQPYANSSVTIEVRYRPFQD